jgi:4-amino-4-deoxy-L-arabinose transferase-like glycosyltransferase
MSMSSARHARGSFYPLSRLGGVEPQTFVASKLKRLPCCLLRPVLAGLAIRLFVAAIVFPKFMNPARDHWEFAYEMGHIARSLAMGQGFSNPFWGNTGPSALLTPVYPCLLAGIFSVFGVFTTASALVFIFVNCSFSAVTAVPVFLIGRRTFDPRTARLAAWVWALFPYSIDLSAATMWYHGFVALLLSVIVLVALSLQHQDRVSAWLGFGILFGFAALTNPVVVVVAPAIGLWLLFRLAQQRKRWIRAGAIGALGMMLTVAPWPIRNVVSLHQAVPFKDGFWMEVCVGNVNGALHWWDGDEHPSGTAVEAERFAAMGEFPYMAAKRQKAFDFIRNHPGSYAWRSLRHAIFMWTGFWSFNPRYLRMEPFDPPNIFMATALTVLATIGLRRLFRSERQKQVALLFLLVLVLFPLPYHLSHLDPGFRHPLDPLLVVLASGAVVEFFQRRLAAAQIVKETQFAFR